MLGDGGDPVSESAAIRHRRQSPPVNNPVDYLLNEYARTKAENRRLHRDVRELRKQRDRWREEARNWKWGYLSLQKRGAA